MRKSLRYKLDSLTAEIEEATFQEIAVKGKRKRKYGGGRDITPYKGKRRKKKKKFSSPNKPGELGPNGEDYTKMSNIEAAVEGAIYDYMDRDVKSVVASIGHNNSFRIELTHRNVGGVSLTELRELAQDMKKAIGCDPINDDAIYIVNAKKDNIEIEFSVTISSSMQKKLYNEAS